MRYGVGRLLTLICLFNLSLSAPLQKDERKSNCQCRKKFANPYDFLNLQTHYNVIPQNKSTVNDNFISKVMNTAPNNKSDLKSKRNNDCTCGNNCRCGDNCRCSKSNSNLLLPWMMQKINVRGPRLVKVYQTKIVEQDAQPLKILKTFDFGFWKPKQLKKRDITAEYNLLEQEHQPTDWTSPDITQYMPETLRQGFDHSNIFCSPCSNANSYKQKRNANELETDQAKKRSAESTSHYSAERNADKAPKLDQQLSMPSEFAYAENFQGSPLIDAYLGQIFPNSNTPSNARSQQENGESTYIVGTTNYEDDHWGHVIRNIVDKYQDFNEASIPIEEQEWYNLKFYTKLITGKL